MSVDVRHLTVYAARPPPCVQQDVAGVHAAFMTAFFLSPHHSRQDQPFTGMFPIPVSGRLMTEIPLPEPGWT